MHVYGVAETRANLKRLIDEARNGSVIQIGARNQAEVQLTSAKNPALTDTSLSVLARALGHQQAQLIMDRRLMDLKTKVLPIPDNLAADVIWEFCISSATRPATEFMVTFIKRLHSLQCEDQSGPFEFKNIYRCVAMSSQHMEELEVWLLSEVKPTVDLFLRHLLENK